DDHAGAVRHQCQGLLHAVEGPCHVDLHHPGQVFEGLFNGGLEDVSDGGVVYQHIDVTVPLFDLLERCGYGFVIGDIERNAEAVRTEFDCSLLRAFAIEHDNLVALARKLTNDGCADATTAT